MAKELSLNTFFDIFKEALPGFITALPEQLFGGLYTCFGGIIGMLAKKLGWEETIEEYKQKATDIVTDAITSIDKDLGVARTGSQRALTQFFSKSKTSLGLEESTLAATQRATESVATNFFKDGIPKLDDQGRPVDAYVAAIALRTELATLYKGDGINSVGILPTNIPKAEREKLAEAYATYFTGVPQGATIVDLAAQPPTTGLVAMLASTQMKRHAEGFVKESLREDDIAMPIDAKLLASAAANSKVTGGDTVKTNNGPPAGINPNKAVVGK